MQLINVSKKFGDKIIFDKLNLEFDANECVAITGRSGIGKTTFLNVIAGVTSFEGEIMARGKVAYMLQEDVFIENLSVADNLKLFTKKARAEVLKMLSDLGMREVADLLPCELSGGMQRRVSFLRALYFDADILLLDEPFKSLDEQTSALCVRYLSQFLQQNKRLVIIVTHNISELKILNARVLDFERLLQKE